MLYRLTFPIHLILYMVTNCPASDQEYWTEKREAAHHWVEEHYQESLNNLFPLGLAVSDVLCNDRPECPEWVITSRAFLPWNDLEFQFSFEKAFDGSIKASFIDPVEKSLFYQLVDLHMAHPDDSFEQLLLLTKIKKHAYTDKEKPNLKNFVHDFESLRMSPLPPNALILDGFYYHFWIRVNYGNPIEYRIQEPNGGWWGNRGDIPHPLTKWAEAVRQAFSINANISSKYQVLGDLKKNTSGTPQKKKKN